MPNGIIPDEGLAAWVKRIVDPGGASPASWRLILWVNDLVPDTDTVLADLTLATFTGYSFVTLMPGAWTDADVVDGCATTTYTTAAQTWYVIDAMGQTVYGFALTDPGAGQLRFIQRFDDDDIVPLESGGRISLLPTLTLTSAACSSMMARRASRRRKLKR